MCPCCSLSKLCLSHFPTHWIADSHEINQENFTSRCSWEQDTNLGLMTRLAHVLRIVLQGSFLSLGKSLLCLTPEYLVAQGLAFSLLHSIGSMLKIKPCLRVNISDLHSVPKDGLFFCSHFACIPANSPWWSSQCHKCSLERFRAIASWWSYQRYLTGQGAFILFQDDWLSHLLQTKANSFSERVKWRLPLCKRWWVTSEVFYFLSGCQSIQCSQCFYLKEIANPRVCIGLWKDPVSCLLILICTSTYLFPVPPTWSDTAEFLQAKLKW